MWFIHPSANGHQSAHGFRCQGAARTGKEGSLIEDTDLRNKRWDPWGDKSTVVLRCFVATCESVNLLSVQRISINWIKEYQTCEIPNIKRLPCREFDTFGTALSEETIRSIYYCKFLVPCCTSIRRGIIWMFNSRRKYSSNAFTF